MWARIRGCAIFQQYRWFFFKANFFVHFSRSFFGLFLQKREKKYAIKKLKWSLELLENFVFCHAAVFKLCKVLKYFCIERKCRKLWKPDPSLCPPPSVSYEKKKSWVVQKWIRSCSLYTHQKKMQAISGCRSRKISLFDTFMKGVSMQP